MTVPKILIADSISQSGVDELARDGALEVLTQTGLSESALVEIIPDFSAVVVRSQTKITAAVLNAGSKLRVVAYDPYLSATRARTLQVELIEELDDLLAAADFITLHTPLTPETHHLLNRARLEKTRRGVRVINCARGGLIDELALAEALRS